MTEHKTILVVEDDAALMLGLEENLKAEGYTVLKSANGTEGLKLALQKKPDLLLLDVMLPGLSGFEICRRLREQKVLSPVIMLTARSDEFDKLTGFDVGADDYITKPFSIKELLARVRAMFRRGERVSVRKEKYRFGEFELDNSARTLMRHGQEIPLTRTEFDLLSYFLANEGKALDRDTLVRDVWGLEYLGTQRSLDSFVAILRGKVEKNPREPKYILTVHGVGYKFVNQRSP